MKVRVLGFARLRELLGASRDVELPPDATVAIDVVRSVGTSRVVRTVRSSAIEVPRRIGQEHDARVAG